MSGHGSSPRLGTDARRWIEARGGVVSREELLSGGFRRRQIDGWLKGGRLVVLHRGVYALGHTALRDHGRWRAAVLATGAGSVLSHRSAAALHGMLAEGTVIHVTGAGRWRGLSGRKVHQTRYLDALDVTGVAHVPVTTVARTLVDLGDTETYAELRRAADALRHLDLEALQEAQERAPGRRGARRVRHLLDRDHARTKSEMEREYLRFCRATGIRRPDGLNAFVGRDKVDALYAAERVVVELDGRAHHARRAQMREDRARDARLLTAGHRPLRLVWEDVAVPEERATTAARIAGLLAAARRSRPVPVPVPGGRTPSTTI